MAKKIRVIPPTQPMDGKIKRVAPLPAPCAGKPVCTLFLERLPTAP